MKMLPSGPYFYGEVKALCCVNYVHSVLHIPSASVCIHVLCIYKPKSVEWGSIKVGDTAWDFCYNTIHIAT